jgi:hypothetical protein
MFDSYRPINLSDETLEYGELSIGGNSDVRLLYDPSEENVREIPDGSRRTIVIDQVTCRTP